MSESDGVDEVVGGGIRVAITAAGLVAERLAQGRAQRAREAEAASIEEIRRLEARLDVERSTARAQLAQVDRDGWWENAGVSDVADAWETAQSWRQLDPVAERAAERIEREVRDRYGVDVHDVEGLDRVALERAAAAREGGSVERRRARQAGEELQAALVLTANDTVQVAGPGERSPQPPRWWQRDPGEYPEWVAKVKDNERLGWSHAESKRQAYDYLDRNADGKDGLTTTEAPEATAGGTAARQTGKPDDLAHQVVAGIRGNAERDVTGRRADLARALSGVDDHEAVEARLQADVSSGRPVREAVTTPRQKAPKARKDRGAGVQVRQRGLGR